ncbi:MAG: xanthine dehydrogenase family protein molybdopterin-binding subunit [Acidimicrobiia bacterium]
MIGRPLRRLEDSHLITGRGRYVDDISLPSTAHAVFVRSVEAHALIRSVSLDQRDAGRARLFGPRELGLTAPVQNQHPSPLIERSTQAPPLSDHEVCFVGQPIAVVVAPTAQEATDAAAAVLIDYEPLPTMTDHRRALDVDAPPVHLGGDGNLIATLSASFGEVEAGFATAPRRLALDVDQHRGAGASMEGRAILASWEEGELKLWTSTQAPYAVRSHLASYLGLKPDSVRVIAPDVGGGFGPKAAVYPEEYVVAALAIHLRQPVKWIEQRRENFTATYQQRGQSGRIEVAFDDNGRVLALRAHLTHDCGAFVPYGIVVPMTTLRLMSGPYRIPALEATIECVFTNATPTAAIRGAGRPNACFALERTMDAIARSLNLERETIRRRNFIPVDALPYQVDIPGSDGRPITYDSGDFTRALDAALEAARIDDFPSRREVSERSGLRRGYGIASYIEDTGMGPFEGARIEILAGGEVLVETGAGAQGQGHETVFAQICAQHLGVEPGRVRVRSGDTAFYSHGVATVASRTGQTTAAAVSVAAEELASITKELAADELEAAFEDIALEGGMAMVVGQPGTEIPFADLVSRLSRADAFPTRLRRPGLSVERVVPFGGLGFTYGTHVAEVEVDPETGHVRVVGYIVVHDCGTLINPMIVDGQIDGGVAHGLGNALMERVQFSDSGQPLTTSFMDYHLMTAVEMPPLVKTHTVTPSPNNPLGTKGAGEGGTIPAAAAVTSAVEHALSDRGVIVNHYPVEMQWVQKAATG